MKSQALADHLVENSVDDEYQHLSTCFPDEEVNSVEVTSEDANAWKMFFDGAVNTKGVGLGAILISPTSQHYPATTRLWFFCTNNTAEYEACNVHIDPLEIQIRERHGYCNTVEVEPNVQPWYYDIKRFLNIKKYPEQASVDQKRTTRRLAGGFLLSGEVLYKKTPDLNL
ncbi:uncharacterized protein LOC142165329 [Nicotiana tabacum]|uniref:Uncharacterized protein LOC142165329 n=1 Tax=Nicotiana tabacum TaxID=4097 RepID=A0AC58S4U8_TOBAC